MPLVKPLLEAQILAALQKISNSQIDLATAIDSYIKAATCVVAALIV